MSIIFVGWHSSDQNLAFAPLIRYILNSDWQLPARQAHTLCDFTDSRLSYVSKFWDIFNKCNTRAALVIRLEIANGIIALVNISTPLIEAIGSSLKNLIATIFTFPLVLTFSR